MSSLRPWFPVDHFSSRSDAIEVLLLALPSMAPSKAAFPESDQDKKQNGASIVPGSQSTGLRTDVRGTPGGSGAVEKETVERLNVLRDAAFEGQKGVRDFLRRGKTVSKETPDEIGLFDEV